MFFPQGTFTKAPGYVQFGPMDWNLNNARQKLVRPWPIFSPDQPRFQSLFITSPCSEGLELEGVAPFYPLAYHHRPYLVARGGIILHFPTQQQNGWYSSWVCGKLKNQVVCSSHPKHAARRVHFGMSRTSQLLFHLLLTHSDPVQRHRGQPHIFSGWWF